MRVCSSVRSAIFWDTGTARNDVNALVVFDDDFIQSALAVNHGFQILPGINTGQDVDVGQSQIRIKQADFCTAGCQGKREIQADAGLSHPPLFHW